jgi:hypothetical protein
MQKASCKSSSYYHNYWPVTQQLNGCYTFTAINLKIAIQLFEGTVHAEYHEQSRSNMWTINPCCRARLVQPMDSDPGGDSRHWSSNVSAMLSVMYNCLYHWKSYDQDQQLGWSRVDKLRYATLPTQPGSRFAQFEAEVQEGSLELFELS